METEYYKDNDQILFSILLIMQLQSQEGSSGKSSELVESSQSVCSSKLSGSCESVYLHLKGHLGELIHLIEVGHLNAIFIGGWFT